MSTSVFRGPIRRTKLSDLSKILAKQCTSIYFTFFVFFLQKQSVSNAAAAEEQMESPDKKYIVIGKIRASKNCTIHLFSLMRFAQAPAVQARNVETKNDERKTGMRLIVELFEKPEVGSLRSLISSKKERIDSSKRFHANFLSLTGTTTWPTFSRAFLKNKFGKSGKKSHNAEKYRRMISSAFRNLNVYV
jgi:hypothetical protein